MRKYIFAVVFFILSSTGCGYSGNDSVNSFHNGESSVNGRLAFENSNHNDLLTAPTCKDPLWALDFGDARLIWASNDISVDRNGQNNGFFLPSLTKLHKSDAKEAKNSLVSDSAIPEKNEVELKTSTDVSIVSVVERFVTFEIEYGSILDGSSASHWVWWLTLNVSKEGNIEPFSADGIENTNVPSSVSLGDIFSKAEILQGLVENPIIRRELTEGGLEMDTGSLEFLFKDDYNARLKIGDESKFLTASSLDHFMFQRIENDKVIVRLALTEFAVTKTYGVEYLEVGLRIPPVHASAFQAAEKQNVGFLGIDKEKISRGCSTSLNLSTTIPIRIKR